MRQDGVDDIVDAAGVSHGTFYRYFGSKDDFFRVLAEEASGRMVELVERLIAACRAAGVRRLVQVSALNAAKGDSHYLASKGEAEKRAAEAFMRKFG